MATTAAFSISRLRVKGGRLVMNLALFTYFTPPMTGGCPASSRKSRVPTKKKGRPKAPFLISMFGVYLMNGHLPSFRGRKASLAGTVASSL